MKTSIRLSLLLVVLAVFSGCTFFKERAIKSDATDAIKSKIKQALEKERDAILKEPNVRGKDFEDYVLDHTTIDIQSSKEISPTQLHVEATLETVSPAMRKMVWETLVRLGEAGSASYNFGEALHIVNLQKPEFATMSHEKMSLDLHDDHGHWVL